MLVEPNAEFKVLDGQIPPPIERGSVERRMRLMSSPNRRPSMVEWATVEYQRQFLTQDHKDLIYEINLVCQEMQTIGHTLLRPERGQGLTVALSNWADIIAKKSPLIQAISSCHAETYVVCRRVKKIVKYTTSQYASEDIVQQRPTIRI